MIYSTEAFLDKHGDRANEQCERSYKSVDEAKNAPFPHGFTYAMIPIDAGAPAYSAIFGWEFLRAEQAATRAAVGSGLAIGLDFVALVVIISRAALCYVRQRERRSTPMPRHLSAATIARCEAALLEGAADLLAAMDDTRARYGLPPDELFVAPLGDGTEVLLREFFNRIDPTRTWGRPSEQSHA